MNRILVLLSGGMDSATAVGVYTSTEKTVEGVSFNYGQRHGERELEAAREVAKHYGIVHHVLDLSGAAAAFEGSALTGTGEVPEGHYEDESMKKTVVPNRNMTMLSLAAGLAIARGIKYIAYGAHAGDHAIYPDCRPAFYDAVQIAINEGNYSAPLLVAPFLAKTKAEIANIGHSIKVPFSITWSCYKGGNTHCGQCGTCVERKEAFDIAGIQDPTAYA